MHTTTNSRPASGNKTLTHAELLSVVEGIRQAIQANGADITIEEYGTTAYFSDDFRISTSPLGSALKWASLSHIVTAQTNRAFFTALPAVQDLAFADMSDGIVPVNLALRIGEFQAAYERGATLAEAWTFLDGCDPRILPLDADAEAAELGEDHSPTPATESRAGTLLGEWKPITREQYWRLRDQHRADLTVWAEHNEPGREDYVAEALRTASVPFIDFRSTLDDRNEIRVEFRRFHPAEQPRKHVLSMDCWCKPTELRPINVETGHPGRVQHHGDLTGGFVRERDAWGL